MTAATWQPRGGGDGRPADSATVLTRKSILAVRSTAAVVCVFGAVVLTFAFYRFVQVFPGAAVLAVLLELPLLVVGFVLLRLLRPVRSPALGWSAAAVIWGGSAAAGCALLANQGLTGLWAKTLGTAFASNWSATLSAPLNEEVLKLCGVIMIVLAAPRVLNGPLDGLFYGALTGLGFQVAENVTYGLNSIALSGATNPDRAVLNSAVLRLTTTTLGSHWAMTAMAGAGVGFFVQRGRSQLSPNAFVGEDRAWLAGLLPAAGCLLIAMGMHLLFDAPRPNILIKVLVNLLVVGVSYLILSTRYLERVHRALARQTDAGQIGWLEADYVLSRRRRLHELQRADSPEERRRLLARQHEILARIDQDAA